MGDSSDLLLGEFERTLDERFRLSIPAELLPGLAIENDDLVLVKERAGCLSLWNARAWKSRMDSGLAVLKAKLNAGKVSEKLPQLQRVGRLLSTRYKVVQAAGKGRVLIPEGFREFLHVEASGGVIVVGAAICIEIWRPESWRTYLEQRMPRFQKWFDELAN